MVFELTGQTIVLSTATLWALYQCICWVMDRYQIGEKRKEYFLIKESTKATMREVIRNTHKDAIKAGSIDEDELQHIEEVYAIYHSLKGNGTGDRWMKEIRELPRR